MSRTSPWTTAWLAAPLAAAALFAAAPAGAQTPVRVVVSEYSAKTGPYFEEVAKAFEAQHPDIDIQIEVVSWDTLQQKLTTDIAGGNAPDLSIIGTRWLLDFVADGVAEPLDDYMTPEFRELFIPSFFAPSVLDGKTYGLPIAASARALYYNKSLFEQAGLDPNKPPATWDELYEDAVKISGLGDDVHGFGLQGKEIETDAYWYYALWSFGGDLLVDGKSGVGSPQAIEAANFYKRLIDEGLTQPGVTANNREDVQNLFKAGRVGMMITAPFLRTQIAEEAPDLQYGIAPIPSKAAQATYGVTDSIVMFSTSDVKDEAWQFMEFVFTPENRIAFTKNEGFLPITTAESEDPYFADDPQLAAFTALLPSAKFAPTIPHWEEMADATSRALQQIYTGDAMPETALPAAAAEIDELMAQ